MIYFRNPNLSGGIKELILSLRNPEAPLYKFKQTFTDKYFTEEQCHIARRSFYDIVEICQTYFETTKEEVARTLVDMVKDPTENFGCHICHDIHKVVFLFNKIIMSTKDNESVESDGLCYNDIVKLAEEYKSV